MSHLIEVFRCGPHFLPGFIQQLNADTEELFPCAVMREEHGVVVIAAFISYTRGNASIEWQLPPRVYLHIVQVAVHPCVPRLVTFVFTHGKCSHMVQKTIIWSSLKKISLWWTVLLQLLMLLRRRFAYTLNLAALRIYTTSTVSSWTQHECQQFSMWTNVKYDHNVPFCCWLTVLN